MNNYNTKSQILGVWGIAQLNPVAENNLLPSEFLEKQSEQTILKSVEIDSEEAGIYRVWRDSQMLGKFHRDIANGLWICQPCNYKLAPRFETSNDAVIFIVEMNALTVA